MISNHCFFSELISPINKFRGFTLAFGKNFHLFNLIRNCWSYPWRRKFTMAQSLSCAIWYNVHQFNQNDYCTCSISIF